MGQLRPENDGPDVMVALTLCRRDWMLIRRSLDYALDPVATRYGIYGETDVRLVSQRLEDEMRADPELAREADLYHRKCEERARRQAEHRSELRRQRRLLETPKVTPLGNINDLLAGTCGGSGQEDE